MDLMGLCVGPGTMQHTFACLALSLQILFAIWLNHVYTLCSQSLWKWDLKIMPFWVGTMEQEDSHFGKDLVEAKHLGVVCPFTYLLTYLYLFIYLEHAYKDAFMEVKAQLVRVSSLFLAYAS